MKSKLRLISCLLILFGVTFTYNNCSQPVSFDSNKITGQNGIIPDAGTPDAGTQNTSTNDPNNNSEVDPVYLTKVYEQTVNSGQTVAPLDVIWVIDNSGSMTDEAESVRTNLSNFINYVQNQSDLRLAVISKQGTTGNSVSVPIAPNLLQINYEVDSYNGPNLLASSICPTSNAPAACNLSVIPTNLKIRGKLLDFLRPTAKKAIIFVTDDNSKLSSLNFLAVTSAVFGNQQVVISAFRGLGITLSPCQANEGLVYKDLVSKTGGLEFNICSTDWSGHFESLAKKSVLLSFPRIEIAKDIVADKIISVELNNVVLNKEQYKIDLGAIVFPPELVANQTVLNVKISYSVLATP